MSEKPISVQGVFIDGERVDVPLEVFQWLVDFSEVVSTTVKEITGRVAVGDEERALKRLGSSLVMMAPGSPCMDFSLGGTPSSTGDPVGDWLDEHHAVYTRLVYDLMDVSVQFSAPSGWWVNLRHALSDVLDDDVDPDKNWDAVRLDFLQKHPSSTQDEAISHADEYGFIVNRKYGRELVDHFLRWDMGSPSMIPLRWAGVGGQGVGRHPMYQE